MFGVGEHGHDPGRRRVAVRGIADEQGLSFGIEHGAISGLAGIDAAGPSRGAGLAALLVHRRLEPGQVHGDSCFLGHLHGELHREPIGVVEAKGDVTGQGDLPGGQLLIEDC